MMHQSQIQNYSFVQDTKGYGVLDKDDETKHTNIQLQVSRGEAWRLCCIE
jgi:hypothetical protein